MPGMIYLRSFVVGIVTLLATVVVLSVSLRLFVFFVGGFGVSFDPRVIPFLRLLGLLFALIILTAGFLFEFRRLSRRARQG